MNPGESVNLGQDIVYELLYVGDVWRAGAVDGDDEED
jgi:hypothetical protein